VKIAHHALSRFIDVPEDPRALRLLLDDVGIEVKRMEPSAVPDAGTTYTIELLANRGDHYCYHGIAREIGGRTGVPMRLPPRAELAVGDTPFPLRNETPLCPRYSATLLERTGPPAPLPPEVLLPLEAAGIHSISPPVDASNLGNLELGQPTHAFDADTLVGAVIIRTSRPGETCLPLFTEERVTLPEGTLVIADEEKILAVAGVIGCEESKATEHTTRLLLESACFHPVAVRKAARALGLHTDASARFERGSDPLAVLAGAGRVVHLLETHAGWSRVGEVGMVGDWADPERTILLDVPAAAAFLEHPLTPAEAAERLARYGFAVTSAGDQLAVRVPPHRLWDVEFAADLHEELAKSIGYNETPEHLPPVGLGALPSHEEEVQTAVDEVLVGHGFYEVITDGFYGRDLLQRAGIDEGHPLAAHVETMNALDRGYSLLKNNALLQAVEAVASNLRMRTEQVAAFEWTRTFHPDATAPNGVCSERRLLWAIACGHDREPSWAHAERPADPIFLEGVAVEIGAQLRLPLQVRPGDGSHPLASLLHPNRQAVVVLDGQVVGILGEVHPAVAQAFKIKRDRPVYLELELEPLLRPGEEPAYVEPSDLHPIVRSLAFTLPRGVHAAEVADRLRADGPAWLQRVVVTDLFAHEEGGEPVRTITYRLEFTTDEQARSADEVNATCEALVAAVGEHLGDRGVKLR